MLNLKNLPLSFAVLAMTSLIASPSFAVERAFRLDRHNISDNGYAIAWGVKGKLVDFEKIEQAGDDAVSTFIAENVDNMENYIVDAQTNAIISKISAAGEPMISANLGGVHIGNHFSYGIADVAVNGLAPKGDEELEAVALISHFKWSSGLANIQIIRRQGGKVEAISMTDGLNEKILEQVRARLPSAQRAKFDEMAFSLDFGRTLTTPAGRSVMEYTLDGQIPKADGEMKVTGTIAFKLSGKKVIVKVTSAKVSK